MVSEVAAIQAINASTTTQLRLPEPGPVEMRLMHLPKPDRAAAGAYTDLRSPQSISNADFGSSWAELAVTIADGSRKGLMSPHMRNLELGLEKRAARPDEVSANEIMLLAMKVSQASTVSSVLSGTVSSVRSAVKTLVERTG